jgi:hypothetical protein
MGDCRIERRSAAFGALFHTSQGAEFNCQFVRIAVLYEDLSLEVHGIDAARGSLPTLERHSHQYRRIYFARRAICTLCEFANAVSQLSKAPHFKILAEGFDPVQTQAWNDAKTFFDLKQSVIKQVRNDVGGHFGEEACRQLLTKVDPEYVASLSREFDRDGAWQIKVDFASELAAKALLLHAPGQGEEEKMSFVIELLQGALLHATSVAHAVFGPSLWHKMTEEP